MTLVEQVAAFMDDCVYPAEPGFLAEAVAGGPADRPSVMDNLQNEARRRGLWDTLLPVGDNAARLDQRTLNPLVELTGRSPVLAPDALNLATPDSENMRLLDAYGTSEQQAAWLTPSLEGSIRSALCITEPGLSGADPTEIATTIETRGDSLVITGQKHWCTGAADARCKVLLVVGVCDPDAPRHARHGIALVPTDTPGVEIDGAHSVFGYHDGFRGGRASVRLDSVVVPRSALLGEPGTGFALMQTLLGPARLQHCMRLVGVAERALELLCRRAADRTAFGEPLADKGLVQDWVAESRIRIEHLRALVAHGAEVVDTGDDRAAATVVAVLKASAPASVEWIVDKAIQVHGADGFSHGTPLAMLWTYARTLRVSDGPDEVHRRTVALRELKPYRTG